MKAKLKAVYHMLINIFGRLTLGLTAAFIISIIGFVVYAYVCDYIARRTTPWQANISEKVYKAAFQAQTTLESPKERLIGGGQAVKLPGPTAYLTVYHVAIEAVDAPMRGEFRSKVTSSNTRIESLRGLGCLKWLDLCMLKGTQDHSAADLGELGNSLTKIGDNLFLLAKKTDQNAEGDIHLGVVSNVSPAIITAEIGTRRGYSGSGVYSTDGSLVGLAVSDNSYGINNAVILSTLGFPAYRFMQTTTEIVSATAIRRLQSCFRVEATQGPDCLNAQIDLFLDQMEFLIKGGHGTKFDFHAAIQYARRFEADFLAQLVTLPEVHDLADYRNVTSIRPLQPGSGERFKAMVGIKNERAASLCSVFTVTDLDEEINTTKDRVMGLAYFLICNKMGEVKIRPGMFRYDWQAIAKAAIVNL